MRVVLVATVVATFTLSVLLWYVWRHRAHKTKKTRERIVNKVIFFPDLNTSQQLAFPQKTPDSSTAPIEEGLYQKTGQGSLWELFKALQNAKLSIDVCVLTIASRELSDALISAHQCGVIVRVVTNDEQMLHSETQVNRLRRAGIQVRIDETEFIMHHKFAIIDGELLTSGSLNWTTKGLCGNQENVILTSEASLVQPFLHQFGYLWKKYSPPQDLCT